MTNKKGFENPENNKSIEGETQKEGMDSIRTNDILKAIVSIAGGAIQSGSMRSERGRIADAIEIAGSTYERLSELEEKIDPSGTLADSAIEQLGRRIDDYLDPNHKSAWAERYDGIADRIDGHLENRRLDHEEELRKMNPIRRFFYKML